MHTFVYRFLLQWLRSVSCKAYCWYFLLVPSDFYHESKLAVIIQDRDRNSVTIMATTRVEIFRSNFDILAKKP